MDAVAFYIEHLKQINEAIRIICRRSGMGHDEEMDFAQHVHLQLIENDYRRLRAFKGSSSIKTYLHTVVSRIFIDSVRSKWHPSTEAQRMGAAAVELERLVHRQRYAVHEACQIMAANPVTVLEESAAYAILDKLQVRWTRPRPVDDPEAYLPNVPDQAPDPEKRASQQQVRKERQRIIALIGTISSSLSGEDKLLIKLLFIGDRKVSEIARLLGKSDRQLYKRIQTILRRLRDAMADAGIREDDVRNILDGMGEHDD
ncbi:MAG: sigma-70 family RNA polymerase sigma factor [Nitrospirota bacterium]|nr:sigma-70 family RNA polymerase sigma factor [Nitrospirota bacterium]